MPNLKVIINKTGNVTIEVVGAAGSSCHLLTKQLEQALGEVTTDTLKPEFYEQQQAIHETLGH